ncbi:MFS transporter [Dactylosporangium fulvum]|uniref:MFS transporter n=1 Tax=Dactylosporangium fulvum TaxID=53359 RepID=UPI0031E224FD
MESAEASGDGRPGDRPPPIRSLLPSRGRLRSLRHPPFLGFWLSFCVTQLGFWMASVSLQWLTARIAHNGSLELGFLYFFNLIPLFLIAPWAGVVADRYRRAKVVAYSQAAISVMCAVLAGYLALSGGAVQLPLIYGFAFGLGTLLAIGAPSAQAIVAGAVPPADLASAVGLQSASLNVARVVGPVLATPLLVVWGAAPVFAVYAATSLLAATIIRRLRLAPQPLLKGGERTWRRIRQGLAHVRERPPALQVLVMVAVTSMFGTTYVAQLPVFAYDVLGGGDTEFTLLVGATGLGAVVGALAASSGKTVPRVRQVAAQMVVTSVAVAAMAITTNFVLLLALAVLAAGLNFSIMTRLNVILQSAVAEGSRGRVMSLYVVAWGGLVPVGALLLGFVAGFLGLAGGLVVFALTLTTFGVAMLLRRRPSGAAFGTEQTR